MITKYTMNIKTAFLCIFYFLPIVEALETSIGAPIESTIATNASLTTMSTKNHCREGRTFEPAGLCLHNNYHSVDPPNTTITKVYYDYVSRKILNIKEEVNIIELEVEMRISWEDHRIDLLPSFIKHIKHFDFYGIYVHRSVATEEIRIPIWRPYQIKIENVIHQEEMNGPFTYLIFITGRTAMGIFSDLRMFSPVTDPNTTAIVMRQDLQITLPCSFDPNTFPFDAPHCKLRYSNEVAQNLIPIPLRTSTRTPMPFSKYGFTITELQDDGIDKKGSAFVGLKYKMKRILSPFVFQYFLPAAAIVFVSDMGFIIPSSATPGRVGLLATLFLTLTNLFINHMVSLAKNH